MTERGSCTIGDTTIEYTVNRSARRKKTIEITIDAVQGVLVAAPVRVSRERIKSVVRNRAEWIVCKVSESDSRPRPREFVSGESIPYLGRGVMMIVDPTDTDRATLKFDHWSFRIQAPALLNAADRRNLVRSELVDWYRKRAEDRVPSIVGRWIPRLGIEPTRVLVRDQRRRWGSCSADGTLRFNWRIVMAEPPVIDYLVVHEMLHLKTPNHSRSYWREFARTMPDYEVRRRRLKEIGPTLDV